MTKLEQLKSAYDAAAVDAAATADAADAAYAAYAKAAYQDELKKTQKETK